MFGGRDFAYVRVVRPGQSVTALGSGSSKPVPAVADALLPVAAALVALLFVFLLPALVLEPPGRPEGALGSRLRVFRRCDDL